MNYTPNVRKSTQTFVNVLQKAKDWFASLSKTEQQNLIDELEHGAGHLTNVRQLNAYIAKYGEIHQAKLLHAYEKIPLKYGTRTASLSLIMAAGKVLLKWFFRIIWLRNMLIMITSEILSSLNLFARREYNIFGTIQHGRKHLTL